MISFKEMITLEYIEEEISPEEIFEHYLYPVDFSAKYLNPFRDDTHPDCNYYVSKTGVLYFVDNARGKKHYNCYAVVMQHYNGCTFKEALMHIYEDLIEKRTTPVNREEIALKRKNRVNQIARNIKIKTKNFTPEELAYWNIGGLEVTEKELNDKGIYSVETLWENTWVNDNLKFVFAYVQQGKITQIYYPRRKKGERRFVNTAGFTIGNLNNLKNEDTLVITKSRKDVFYLEKFGINAIYTINETITIDQELFKKLKNKYPYIFTLFDSDKQGQHSAWVHRKIYGIPALFVPEGKDFSGWLEQVGYQEVSDTIEEFKQRI